MPRVRSPYRRHASRHSLPREKNDWFESTCSRAALSYRYRLRAVWLWRQRVSARYEARGAGWWWLGTIPAIWMENSRRRIVTRWGLGEEAVRQRLRLQQARGRGGRAEVTVRVRVRGDGGRGARAHPNKLRSPIATHVCFFSSRAVRASTYSECLQLRCVCGPLTTSCALCAPAKS